MSQDEIDFAATRRATDEQLAARIAAIRQGQDIDALVPFAKAYLGLFREIDPALAPATRLLMVASPEVADAVLTGFDRVLRRSDIAPPCDIVAAGDRAYCEAFGYVMLAGMHRRAARSLDQAIDLPDATLCAALAYYYLQPLGAPAPWVNALIRRRPALAASALLGLWQALLPDALHLPGLTMLLQDSDSVPVLQRVLLPLLSAWTQCRRADLESLLRAALRYVDASALLQVAQAVLARGEDLDVAKRVYWLATAFVLEPDAHAAALANYAGRSRDKVLPLVDFIGAALDRGVAHAARLPASALGQLLRIIAPQFRRNHHEMGELDAVSQTVLRLFAMLIECGGPEAVQTVQALRKVRVMRCYADVLNAVEARLHGTAAG